MSNPTMNPARPEGRRKRGDAELRRFKVTTYLRPAEARALLDAVDAEGATTAGWLRQLVVGELRARARREAS